MERLDKILANTGRWSRKEAKALIKSGRVKVDGQQATSPEEKIPENATLLVDGHLVSSERYTYLMLHKPQGVVSSTEDPREPTVLGLLPPHLRKLGLFPVGRLDKDAEGLLLLTDDGALTNALLHPRHGVEKEYRVWVTGDAERALPVLSAPVEDGGEVLTADRVERTGKNALTIVIHQGKNRQVRRMCAAAGLRVDRLRRVREGELVLGGLGPGKWRPLTAEELTLLQV